MRERIMATSPKEEIPTSELGHPPFHQVPYLVSFSRQRKQEMMVRMTQETMRIVVLEAVMPTAMRMNTLDIPIIEKGRRDEKSVNTIYRWRRGGINVPLHLWSIPREKSGCPTWWFHIPSFQEPTDGQSSSVIRRKPPWNSRCSWREKPPGTMQCSAASLGTYSTLVDQLVS